MFAVCFAYNLGDLLRTLAVPEAIKNWSGAKVVSHGRGRRVLDG
jgi:hypothetical protein